MVVTSEVLWPGSVLVRVRKGKTVSLRERNVFSLDLRTGKNKEQVPPVPNGSDCDLSPALDICESLMADCNRHTQLSLFQLYRYCFHKHSHALLNLPTYIYLLLFHYQPTRTLHSSDQNLLALPTSSSKFGRNDSSQTASLVWNNLPLPLHSLQSLDLYKSRLKTHLFTGSNMYCLWRLRHKRIPSAFRPWLSGPA